jgi:hypothetical protein
MSFKYLHIFLMLLCQIAVLPFFWPKFCRSCCVKV